MAVMKKVAHFLFPVVLVTGFICVLTAIASAPSCSLAPRKAYGDTVDGSQAIPVGGVFLTCQCISNQIQCLGQDGRWHVVATCPNGCNAGVCR